MASKISEKDFKIVPHSLEEITADWCEKILRDGSTIAKDTTVTNVEVLPITDESSGFEDGGGFSGSSLIKMVPTYGGNVSGNEPASMVCKISGNNKRDLNFVWRFIGYVMYGPWEDHLNRHETAFYQQVAPHLKDTSFRYPKVYFAGMDDKGNNSFSKYVVMNKPSQVRSILVMEDLSDWKTKVAGTKLSTDEVITCLKNIAIMHARFWGEKQKDIKEYLELPPAQSNDKEVRPSKYHSKFSAWKRKKFLSSPASIKKKIDHISASEWEAHYSMKIPKGSTVPDWFTLQPLEDGTIVAMKDPMIIEMLSVFAERLPKYNQENLIEFNQRDVETIVHGDFHGGNHKFGTGQNEGKVIVLDFQITGKGLVCTEVIQWLCGTYDIRNYDEAEQFFKEYHNSLVEHGVTDYDWPKFLHDLEMALVELAIITIDLCNTMKPETFMKIMCKISGEEKAEGMKKIFEDTGWMNKAFLILTSLYVKDKDNFM